MLVFAGCMMKQLVPMFHWDELVDIFLVKRPDHPGGIFDGEESRFFFEVPCCRGSGDLLVS